MPSRFGLERFLAVKRAAGQKAKRLYNKAALAAHEFQVDPAGAGDRFGKAAGDRLKAFVAKLRRR